MNAISFFQLHLLSKNSPAAIAFGTLSGPKRVVHYQPHNTVFLNTA